MANLSSIELPFVVSLLEEEVLLLLVEVLLLLVPVPDMPSTDESKSDERGLELPYSSMSSAPMSVSSSKKEDEQCDTDHADE